MSIRRFVEKHPLTAYFGLTFAISWGWVLVVVGGHAGIPATTEQFNRLLPLAIPAMLLGPSVAGMLLLALTDGRRGLRELRSRLFRWQVGARWYAIALLTPLLISTTVLLALSLTSPVFLPGVLTTRDRSSMVLFGLAGAFGAGVFEELGWTGFAVPKLRTRHGVFATGAIVGVLWGAWHILTNDVWAAGTSSGAGDMPVGLFVALRALALVAGGLPAFRILMVWVYDRTGSLLIAMLMHVSLTATTLIAGPVAISGTSLLIDDFVSGAVTWLVVVAVVVINGGRLSRPAAAPGTSSLEAA